MKKFIKILLVSLLTLSLTACIEFGSSSLFKAGTYEADGVGFGGKGKPIHVKVTFSDDAIESIEYTADGETPTVVQKDGVLISESLCGDGAILLNKNGVRFCNEILTRDVVSAHVNEQPDSYAWLIADQNMADKSAVIEKYVNKGYMTKCETVADFAKLIGCDEATAQESLEKWSSYCGKVDEYKYSVDDAEFGRSQNGEMKTDMNAFPLYAVHISPGIHHCKRLTLKLK